ncbi:hypothetical protein PIB30_012163 [Stylosanthes scabra]|uniref:Uncharacterized protein n=1 Tax=Stylosanthes scabra TaxID=79078 RepID=A0ABU6T5X1_9FABA|nr:hypothetical protein [Stylosanthes scabra]
MERGVSEEEFEQIPGRIAFTAINTHLVSNGLSHILILFAFCKLLVEESLSACRLTCFPPIPATPYPALSRVFFLFLLLRHTTASRCYPFKPPPMQSEGPLSPICCCPIQIFFVIASINNYFVIRPLPWVDSRRAVRPLLCFRCPMHLLQCVCGEGFVRVDDLPHLYPLPS